LDGKKARADELKKEIEETKQEASEALKKFHDESRNMEKLLSRRNTLLQKLEAEEKKMRDLGPLTEAVTKYATSNEIE